MPCQAMRRLGVTEGRPICSRQGWVVPWYPRWFSAEGKFVGVGGKGTEVLLIFK